MSCAHAGAASAAPSSRAARISRRPPRLPGPGFGPATAREEAACAAAWHAPRRARPKPRTTALPIPDHLVATLLSTKIHLLSRRPRGSIGAWNGPESRLQPCCCGSARRAMALNMRGTWLGSRLCPTAPSRPTEQNRRPPVTAARARQARTNATGARRSSADKRRRGSTGVQMGLAGDGLVPCRAGTSAAPQRGRRQASPLRCRPGGCPRMRLSRNIIFNY